MRFVYVRYQHFEHFRLLKDKWKESDCLFINGIVCIKMMLT